LTARERQIAQLAAAGSTTREIAEQLSLAARTVDSHLAHVYTKLRIDGRHELRPRSTNPEARPAETDRQ
jgi:DNA-binding CsgD family transcriptional regulator